jgi:hypothetical protein
MIVYPSSVKDCRPSRLISGMLSGCIVFPVHHHVYHPIPKANQFSQLVPRTILPSLLMKPWRRHLQSTLTTKSLPSVAVSVPALLYHHAGNPPDFTPLAEFPPVSVQEVTMLVHKENSRLLFDRCYVLACPGVCDFPPRLLQRPLLYRLPAATRACSTAEGSERSCPRHHTYQETRPHNTHS